MPKGRAPTQSEPLKNVMPDNTEGPCTEYRWASKTCSTLPVCVRPTVRPDTTTMCPPPTPSLSGGYEVRERSFSVSMPHMNSLGAVGLIIRITAQRGIHMTQAGFRAVHQVGAPRRSLRVAACWRSVPIPRVACAFQQRYQDVLVSSRLAIGSR